MVLCCFLLGLAILCGLVVAYGALLKHRAEIRRQAAETARAIALSCEETKRLEVFVKVVCSARN
jgi:hypothetical protein